MKRLLAIATTLCVLGAMPLPKLSAGSSIPPVPIQKVCAVNYVKYPVDFNSAIWGHDASWNWFVIGTMVATPSGYVAVRNDNVTFAAACPF